MPLKIAVAQIDPIVGDAADGQTALEEVRRVAPSIVLLDIRLPDMDGFDVVRELSRRRAPTRVVLVSTRDAADYGQRIVDIQSLE